MPSPPRDPALDLVAGFHSKKGGQYTPIAQATHGMACSLVGIVADVGETKPTPTGERSKRFNLVDPSSSSGSGISVTIFIAAPDEELLPSARLGQVLLLRNVKVKDFAGKPQGTCYKDSFQWCGYDPAQGKHFYTSTRSSSSPLGPSSVRGSNHDPFFKVSAAELEYFVKISDWWRALNEAQQRNVVDDSQGAGNIHLILQPRRSRQVATISEFEVGVFVDCVIELLEVWKGDINSTIYVTDYSENEHLYDQIDAQNYPIGQRTLVVTLWDGPHAMAEDLEVKSFYLLENIKVKVGRTGYLEGSIGYQDRGIRKIGPGSTQKNFAELLLRKKEYEENPHHSRIKYNEEHAQVPEPMQQGHQITVAKEPSSSRSKCLHTDQKCSSIAELTQCTRCPNRFRIRARIIEYYPRDIKDFVRVECNMCHRILDDRYNLCPDCGDLADSSRTVRYQFAIRVADESGELNVSVSNAEADLFFGGLSARDARDDTEALKTRLSPLLGHLYKWHEEFDDKAKNDPGRWLDLCVYSWVPDVDETLRLYKLFGCRLCKL
ncbi:hypothetical protein JB92DRAFT_1118906 [Gautieria morchelliformis]|nr:hypothetical protein JB92DRAFT_1118906 [Gautieria morchelliformis]